MNSRAARVLLLLVIPGHLIFIYTIYYMKAGHTSITILFNIFYLMAALLQVIVAWSVRLLSLLQWHNGELWGCNEKLRLRVLQAWARSVCGVQRIKYYVCILFLRFYVDIFVVIVKCGVLTHVGEILCCRNVCYYC